MSGLNKLILYGILVSLLAIFVNASYDSGSKIVEADNLVVEFNHSHVGLTRQDFIITVHQTEEMTSSRKVNLSTIISEVNFEDNTLLEIYEWKNISHDVLKMNECEYELNGTTYFGEHYSCGSSTIEEYYLNWKPAKSQIIELNANEYKDNMGSITIPKYNPDKLDKSVKIFKFVVHVPLVYKQNGVGSAGLLTLELDDNEFWDKTHSSWWNTTWTKYKNISIAGDPIANLDGFPVWVNVSYDSDMQADFDDLRFVWNDTELKYEIANRFASNSAWVWVRLPHLRTTGETVTMYYGYSDATDGQDVENTWENFLAVYHMTAGANYIINDSSPEDTDFSNYSGTTWGWNATTGVFGSQSVFLNGAANVKLSQYGNTFTSAFNNSNFGGAYSFECWIQCVSNCDPGAQSGSLINRAQNDPMFRIEAGKPVAQIAGGSDTYSTAVNPGEWTHLVFSQPAGNLVDIYVNGVNETFAASHPASSNPWMIFGSSGAGAGGENQLTNGAIQECRFKKGHVTAEYARRVYQMSNYSTIVFGTETDQAPGNSAPTLLGNGTLPITPGYGNTTYVWAQCNDTDNDLINVSASVTMPNGSVILNANMTLSSTYFYNSSTFSIDYGSDSVGIWNWSITCADNNSQTAKTFGEFNISTIPPVISSVEPGNNTRQMYNSFDFNITVTDDIDSTLTCELFVNDVNISNPNKNGTWELSAERFPFNISEMGESVYLDKAYLVGGCSAESGGDCGTWSGQVTIYDLTTGKFNKTYITDLPVALGLADVQVDEDYIYVFQSLITGGAPNNYVKRFNESGWTNFTAKPGHYGEGSESFNFTTAAGDKLWYVCGHTGDFSDCYYFNTTDDTWTVRANYTFEIEETHSFQDGAIFYIATGYGTDSGSQQIYEEMMYYNATGADAWYNSTHDVLTPVMRGMHAYLPERGEFHIWGGVTNFGAPLAKTDLHQVYNISNGAWHYETNFPMKVSGGSGFAYNGKIYSIGGSVGVTTDHYGNATNTLYVYTPTAVTIVGYQSAGQFNATSGVETGYTPNRTIAIGNYSYYFTCTDSNSFSVNSTTYYLNSINNTAPTATVNISSNDGLNRTASNLTCGHSFSDTDGDPEASHEIRWFNDSAVSVPSVINSTYLTSGNTSKGEDWYCSVRVNDGTEWSGWYNSSILTIDNTPPTATVNISSTDGMNRTLSNLTCGWAFSDTDPVDAEASHEIKWFNSTSNVSITALVNATIVTAGNTTKGENWYCSVRVNDGDDWSSWYNTSALTLVNTPPEPILMNITSVEDGLNRTKSNLTVGWSYTDDDGDGMSNYNIKWYNTSYEITAFQNMYILDANSTAKGQSYKAGVRLSDGFDYGNWSNTSLLLILNTPSIITVNISSNDLNKTTGNLTGAINSWSDDDADTMASNETRWYLNGVENTTYKNRTNILSDLLVEGDIWKFSARGYDGEDWSNWVNSSNLTIYQDNPQIWFNTSNRTYMWDGGLLTYRFIYYVNDSSELSNCTIWRDNTTLLVNSSLTKDNHNEFTIGFPSKGEYQVMINCSDEFNNYNHSRVTFYIFENNPSGGGGGTPGDGITCPPGTIPYMGTCASFEDVNPPPDDDTPVEKPATLRGWISYGLSEFIKILNDTGTRVLLLIFVLASMLFLYLYGGGLYIYKGEQ